MLGKEIILLYPAKTRVAFSICAPKMGSSSSHFHHRPSFYIRPKDAEARYLTRRGSSVTRNHRFDAAFQWKHPCLATSATVGRRSFVMTGLSCCNLLSHYVIEGHAAPIVKHGWAKGVLSGSFPLRTFRYFVEYNPLSREVGYTFIQTLVPSPLLIEIVRDQEIGRAHV